MAETVRQRDSERGVDGSNARAAAVVLPSDTLIVILTIEVHVCRADPRHHLGAARYGDVAVGSGSRVH